MNIFCKIAFFVVSLMALVGYDFAFADEDTSPAPAKRTPAPEKNMGEVIVTGKKFSDTEERRYSTAAKMVFGRE